MKRVDKSEKWTLMKYVKDFNLMAQYALVTRESGAFMDVESLDNINKIMMKDATYVPRYGTPSNDTVFFKLCQVAYYMFAYKAGNRKDLKLVFSPLGNLLLDNIDDKEKVSKIFSTMLFNLPFNHPFNKMSASFNLYPFRLIFKLLRDPRLENKLFCDEVFYWVMWTKEIDKDSYECLIEDILTFRNLSPDVKYKQFKKDLPTEDTLANALHECVYMFGHLEGASIVTHTDPQKSNYIGALRHGGFGRNPIPYNMNETELSKMNRSSRNYRLNFISLNTHMGEFIDKLLESYSYDEKPHDLLYLGTKDYIMHLYNFYPLELQKELNLKSQALINNMFDITNDIKKYSRNQQFGDCYKFEDILCAAFNEFSDVTAEKIAKAGTTDVECIYLTNDEKFDLEAKSTGSKLLEVKTSRLDRHRKEIGSKYTIIVTPYFVKGALQDINNTNNVLLTANSLSNFLYQSVIHLGSELSYKPIYDIIQESLGRDISMAINQYVEETYGIGRGM